ITGVRGLMMRTQNTAQAMRVTTRLASRQSIQGGAKYFAYVKAQLDDKVQEPDRTWLDLASYKIGSGELQDDRIFEENEW
ncbi:transglycosylase SLT domain-containing protein, partial [Pseudomonas syringae group genomosp. 7]|uniref:transglycosylase SLT domain-containing protein n=1 Tax=Pseudomonas syringae group genomosp. 7 TaxID=251699 RepID=UPI00377023E0